MSAAIWEEGRKVPTAVGTGARGEAPEKEETKREKPLLERIREELPQLLEEELAFEKQGYIAVTSEAARRLGFRSLTELAKTLREVSVSVEYKTVRFSGRVHRVVLIPASFAISHREQL